MHIRLETNLNVEVELQMGQRGCQATKKTFMIRLMKYSNREALYAAFVDTFGQKIKQRLDNIPGRFFVCKLKPRHVQKYPRKGIFQLFFMTKAKPKKHLKQTFVFS